MQILKAVGLFLGSQLSIFPLPEAQRSSPRDTTLITSGTPQGMLDQEGIALAAGGVGAGSDMMFSSHTLSAV